MNEGTLESTIPVNSNINSEIHDSGLLDPSFELNYCVILSPKDLLKSPSLSTDQATPILCYSSIDDCQNNKELRNKPAARRVKCQNEGCENLETNELSLVLESNQQRGHYFENDLNRTICLPLEQLNDDSTLIGEDIAVRDPSKKQSEYSLTENGLILETHKTDAKGPNASSLAEAIENGNSSIDYKDNDAVYVSQKAKDNVKQLQESSLESQNKNPLCPLKEQGIDKKGALISGLKKLSKTPSEFNNHDSGLPIVKTLPLVYEVSKFETSEIKSKRNSGNLEVTGLKYTANILSLPSTKGAQKPPVPSQQFNSVYIEKCDNSTFGTKISAEDFTINQYVDLSNVANGIHLNSQLTVTDSTKKESCCSKFRYFWGTLLLGTLITLAVTGTSLVFLDLLPGQEDGPDLIGDISANYSLRLITRGQWSQHPSAKMDDLPYRPAPYVVVCHTAGIFCNNSAICQNVIRSIESWHINSGSVAIGYNFLIAGDGYIYEGRGWKKQGAHTVGINCKSIGVAFVGDFDKDHLLPTMIEAYDILVEEGLKRKALTPDYKMIGAYQFKKTDSPGLNNREILKTWPHWGPLTKNDTKCDDK